MDQPEPDHEAELLSTLDGETSPLESVIVETHEIYETMCAIGFKPDVAAQIVAYMLIEILLFRNSDPESDDDDDDDV